MRALVIGGTGPTGHFIVNGLLTRGFHVTILHSGKREIVEIPAVVDHLHGDVYSPEYLHDVFAERTFDLCITTYGRLRKIAASSAGKVGRFISIGGGPAYRGYMNPMLFKPEGLPVPTRENAPLVQAQAEDEKGWRVVRTEETVFQHHPAATHFRYPYVYGPYQMVPREWCIVRRILDKRPHIILPDDGLTLHTFGYAENLAHAVLLAVDNPKVASGQIYNCGDDEVLTLRQVTETIASAMNHSWEIISMPWQIAVPARPLMMQPRPTHRYLDISKLKFELGYCDVVKPQKALALTAQWLADNPPEHGGGVEQILEDPFDYPNEDKLITNWKNLICKLPSIEYAYEPGVGLHYSGPGGRPRTQETFEK